MIKIDELIEALQAIKEILGDGDFRIFVNVNGNLSITFLNSERVYSVWVIDMTDGSIKLGEY